MTTEVFVSFDYDHDARLKDLLIGQARNPDAPFEVADWSVKKQSVGWEADARRRITRVDQVIVLCGEYMGSAIGVDTELRIARDVSTPYFLLAGYDDATEPTAALSTDKMYTWTWENLKRLIAGAR